MAHVGEKIGYSFIRAGKKYSISLNVMQVVDGMSYGHFVLTEDGKTLVDFVTQKRS